MSYVYKLAKLLNTLVKNNYMSADKVISTTFDGKPMTIEFDSDYFKVEFWVYDDEIKTYVSEIDPEKPEWLEVNTVHNDNGMDNETVEGADEDMAKAAYEAVVAYKNQLIENLSAIKDSKRVNDCADNSGKKFVKFRYCNDIWVDVKDENHLLSSTTAYETVAQTKEKAVSNIKYQVKMKNHLPNSAKILLLEGKVKVVKEGQEQEFYADIVKKEGKKMKTKDGFAFVSPTEEGIVKKLSDVTGKDLANSGIKFYIIEGQNFDEEDMGDYGNEGYKDLIDNTKQTMSYYDEDERGYDYSRDLSNWIGDKASEIANKLCDECIINQEEWVEYVEKIKNALEEVFSTKAFYGDCNKKTVAHDSKTKLGDSKKVKDSRDVIDEYRGYELTVIDGGYWVCDHEGNKLKELYSEDREEFENVVNAIENEKKSEEIIEI